MTRRRRREHPERLDVPGRRLPPVEDRLVRALALVNRRGPGRAAVDQRHCGVRHLHAAPLPLVGTLVVGCDVGVSKNPQLAAAGLAAPDHDADIAVRSKPALGPILRQRLELRLQVSRRRRLSDDGWSGSAGCTGGLRSVPRVRRREPEHHHPLCHLHPHRQLRSGAGHRLPLGRPPQTKRLNLPDR